MRPLRADGACKAYGAEYRDGRINPLAAFAISTLLHLGPWRICRLQRESRSFCRILAGFSFQRSGILPCLIAASSSLALALSGCRHHAGRDDLPVHRQTAAITLAPQPGRWHCSKSTNPSLLGKPRGISGSRRVACRQHLLPGHAQGHGKGLSASDSGYLKQPRLQVATRLATAGGGASGAILLSALCPAGKSNPGRPWRQVLREREPR
jgi:hypothetical protein